MAVRRVNDALAQSKGVVELFDLETSNPGPRRGSGRSEASGPFATIRKEKCESCSSKDKAVAKPILRLVDGRAAESVESARLFSLEVDGERELPPAVQIALFRIAQEALNNVVKHSGARRAWVHLRAEAGLVELSITDDGRGFDLSSVPADHLGLGTRAKPR